MAPTPGFIKFKLQRASAIGIRVYAACQKRKVVSLRQGCGYWAASSELQTLGSSSFEGTVPESC